MQIGIYKKMQKSKKETIFPKFHDFGFLEIITWENYFYNIHNFTFQNLKQQISSTELRYAVQKLLQK